MAWQRQTQSETSQNAPWMMYVKLGQFLLLRSSLWRCFTAFMPQHICKQWPFLCFFFLGMHSISLYSNLNCGTEYKIQHQDRKWWFFLWGFFWGGSLWEVLLCMLSSLNWSLCCSFSQNVLWPRTRRTARAAWQHWRNRSTSSWKWNREQKTWSRCTPTARPR